MRSIVPELAGFEVEVFSSRFQQIKMKFMKLGTKADTFYTEQATRYFSLCSNSGKKNRHDTTFFQNNMYCP